MHPNATNPNHKRPRLYAFGFMPPISVHTEGVYFSIFCFFAFGVFTLDADEVDRDEHMPSSCEACTPPSSPPSASTYFLNGVGLYPMSVFGVASFGAPFSV